MRWYRSSRVEQMVHQPAFPVVLAALFIVLLGWPMLRSSALRPGAIYAYVFLAWALVIAVLYVMSRSAGQPRSRERPGAGRPTS
jgi:ABC-type branched-subunit amino acid transport system permease subunit